MRSQSVTRESSGWRKNKAKGKEDQSKGGKTRRFEERKLGWARINSPFTDCENEKNATVET